MDRIQNYSFNVRYKKRETIPHVDALSRQYPQDEEVGLIEGTITEEEIKSIHEHLAHRGTKVVAEKIKEQGREVSVGKVKEAIKGCKVCKMYNPMRTRSYRHNVSYDIGGKVGFDILESKKVNTSPQRLITSRERGMQRGYQTKRQRQLSNI